MEHVVNCIKCDKTFYNNKDLTNHLGEHAKMDLQFEVEKSLQSMRTTKMQVKIENMKLPIERTKRKREGSGENSHKRIKIQDGANEISVNCLVDQPCCKICKPKRNFKTADAHQYHMVMTHDDSKTSTPINGLTDLPKECLTPNKSKLRVKSQSGNVEIVDMVEESPNKTVIDQSVAVMNKLKSLTCTSVSVSDLFSTIKSEKLDPEELSVKNSKFPKSLEQVSRSTKKRDERSTNGVAGVTQLVQSESLSNCVKLKFKEYVTAESESDFEVTEKEAVEKRKNSKKRIPLEGDEMYQQVSAVIDTVLIQNSIKVSPPPSSLKETPTISSVKPAYIKLRAKHTNGFLSPVKCSEVDILEQGSDVNSHVMVLDESPRSKSGRLLVKSKRLISTESAEMLSIDIKDSDTANFGEYQSLKEAAGVQNGFCEQKLKKELSSSSSKSKIKSDSDSYNPETQSSDSATANSDVEFAQPLRKSNRVRGPKPPQIRDPIENPAPKVKRRLSERKFEGAKPFKCNHCPLDFSNIESKKIHEQTHEEKPFQCVYCDMRFAIEISLKKHTRIHKT